MIGAGKLADETVLPTPGSNDGHDLILPSARMLQGLTQRREFGLAPYEAGQATGGQCLQMSSNRHDSHQLDHLHCGGQALHCDRPQRFHVDIPCGQPQRLSRGAHRT